MGVPWVALTIRKITVLRIVTKGIKTAITSMVVRFSLVFCPFGFFQFPEFHPKPQYIVVVVVRIY